MKNNEELIGARLDSGKTRSSGKAMIAEII